MDLHKPPYLNILHSSVPGWEWKLNEGDSQPQSAQPHALKGLSSPHKSLVYPLFDQNGLMVGNLTGSQQGDSPILPVTTQLIDQLLPLLAELLSMRRKLRNTEELALADPLTCLPNRRAWEQSLVREEQRCRRGIHPAAIICMDLDRLKEQNDSAGHAAGDKLLQKAADCLRKAIRAQDITARIGGDEFGILLVECAADCLPGIVARLQNSLQAAGVEATIGWATRTNDADLHATWQAADQALIAAKRS
jgi:diguanylate cyclase